MRSTKSEAMQLTLKALSKIEADDILIIHIIFQREYELAFSELMIHLKCQT